MRKESSLGNEEGWPAISALRNGSPAADRDHTGSAMRSAGTSPVTNTKEGTRTSQSWAGVTDPFIEVSPRTVTSSPSHSDLAVQQTQRSSNLVNEWCPTTKDSGKGYTYNHQVAALFFQKLTLHSFTYITDIWVNMPGTELQVGTLCPLGADSSAERHKRTKHRSSRT